MKLIEFNLTSGLKLILIGIFIIFISFIFLPGFVKQGQTPSFIPYFMFISGSVILILGLIKVLISLAKKFLTSEVK